MQHALGRILMDRTLMAREMADEARVASLLLWEVQTEDAHVNVDRAALRQLAATAKELGEEDLYKYLSQRLASS